MSEITYLREIEIKFKKRKMVKVGDIASAPAQVYELFKDLENETKEKLLTLFLDSKNKILCFEVVATGSVNSIVLRPVEALKTGLPLNATAVIVVHNHPSGDPTPSEADKRMTKELFRISKILSLDFYDHIIIGSDGQYFSFSEENLLIFEDEKDEGIKIGKAEGLIEGEKKGLELGTLIGSIQELQKLLNHTIDSTEQLRSKCIEELKSKKDFIEQEIARLSYDS